MVRWPRDIHPCDASCQTYLYITRYPPKIVIYYVDGSLIGMVLYNTKNNNNKKKNSLLLLLENTISDFNVQCTKRASFDVHTTC